jgi:magnesium chelatase subunit D
LVLAAVDPAGLRGLWLRGRAGPVRDRVLAALVPLRLRKLHPFMASDALEGAIDLAATLASGKMLRSEGLLQRGGFLALTMAERCPPGLAVRLGQALDADPTLALIALDEAAEDGEGLPPALADRLGLFLDLDDLALSETDDITLPMAAIATARARLARLAPAPQAIVALARLSLDLGINSLRAPLLALACARAHAAWRGADTLDEVDLRLAAELVLGHRATRFPEPDTTQDDAPPPPDPGETPQDKGESLTDIPQDMLIEAARAALPPGLLARLQAARLARSVGGSGAGALKKSRLRGRPLPSRPGKPGSGARVDVVATLRQAAPWQRMRHALFTHLPQDRLVVLPGDIRVKRYQDRTDRVLIFVVDASGSTALARLAEAKGAVELMLAEAYASRDHVALVTFRGQGADLALPPTRSLVQTKRRLAGLPGGGATPLADALRVALDVARQARSRGMAPTLALLTDGRGNIALDGTADRAQAGIDAERLARLARAEGWPSLILDTSLRPKPALAQFAALMGAQLVALPRADAHSLSNTLSAALGR